MLDLSLWMALMLLSALFRKAQSWKFHSCRSCEGSHLRSPMARRSSTDGTRYVHGWPRRSSTDGPMFVSFIARGRLRMGARAASGWPEVVYGWSTGRPRMTQPVHVLADIVDTCPLCGNLTVIAKVVEIGESLPSESAHPDVCHDTRLGVSVCSLRSRYNPLPLRST